MRPSSREYEAVDGLVSVVLCQRELEEVLEVFVIDIHADADAGLESASSTLKVWPSRFFNSRTGLSSPGVK